MIKSISKFPESLILKINQAPVDPGCYLFKNEQSKIIYIGKAKNLKNRVKTYFTQTQSKDPKTQSLVKKIHEIEFFATHSEVEALILENTLIKQYHPRYNILLKDDKTFPYVRITSEPYPRVLITRKLIDDGSKYFGPYTDSKAIKNILRIIKKAFTVRSCQYYLDSTIIKRKKIKLCLQYHIHNCEGPCQDLIAENDYKLMIANIEAFLKGNISTVISYLKDKMETAAQNFRYELAARIRDNLNLLQHYSRRQSVEFRDFQDRDFINLVSEGDIGVAIVVRVRQGKMIGKDTIIIEGVLNSEPAEVLSNFIQQYYNNSQLIPEEINISEYPTQREILEKWLSALHQGAVKITRPTREEKLRLMKLTEKNAQIYLKEYLLKLSTLSAEYIPKTLKELQKDLMLPRIPKRIEAFDISNLQGKFPVGSLVTFYNARPLKREYRRFKIKTVKGIDDFAMVAEVVRRRYLRLQEESQALPDLILIDGGKGQLSAAKQVLVDLNLNSIPILGLAKKLEEIVVPDRSEPLILSRNSISLSLLIKIRDEAHRFAITYHRSLRSKKEITSVLDEIKGLGEKKKQALWKYFDTISEMRSASIEDLGDVEGIGPKLAKVIWDKLHYD